MSAKPGVARIATPVRSPSMKLNHGFLSKKKNLKKPQQFVVKKKTPQAKTQNTKAPKPKKVPTLSKPKSITKVKTKSKSQAKPQAPVDKVEDPPLSVVTCAGIKRVAQRAGIRQISNGCILAVQDYLTKKAEDCLLHARSSAHYVSNTKTIHSRDLASALRTVAMGDLICI